METIRYKGYASENTPKIPNAVDLSETIKKRNDEYIQSLKYLRDYAEQQDSAMIKDFEEQQTRFRESNRKAQSDYIRQKEQIARQKQQRAAALEQRKRQAAGAKPNADVEKLFKGLAEFSATAASTIQDFAEKKVESDKAYGQMLASQYPYNSNVVGVNQQQRDLKIAGSYIEAQAASLRAQGREDEADKLEGLSGWRRVAYNQAMAKQASQNYAEQMELYWQQNPNAELLINGNQIFAKDLDRGDSAAYNEALVQSVPGFMERKGFGDAKPEALVEAYGAINTSIANVVGTSRQNEIENNRENIINQTQQIFYSSRTPEAFRTLYQTIQNQGILNDKETKEALVNTLANTSLVSDEDILALGSVPLGAGQRPMAEQYPNWWKEILKARSEFDNTNRIMTDRLNAEADEELKSKLVAYIQKDMAEDGDVDLTSKEWEAMKLEIMSRDRPESLKFWNQINESKYLASDVKDAELEEHFNGMLAKQLPISQLDVLNSDGSLEFIKKWTNIASNQEGNLVPKNLKSNLDNIIKAEIEGQADLQKAVQALGPTAFDSSVYNAVEAAKTTAYDTYLRIYRATNDSNKAYEAALKEFSDAMKAGTYKAAPHKANDPGTIPGFTLENLTKNTSNQAYAFSSRLNAVKQAINQNLFKPEFTKTTEIATLQEINNTLSQYNLTKSFKNIPAIVVFTAASYPTLTAADILLNQFEYHKVTPPPELVQIVQQQQQLKQNLPPQLQRFLTEDNNHRKSAVVAIQETGTSSLPFITQNQTRVLNTIAATESVTTDKVHGGYDAMNIGGSFNAQGMNIAHGSTTGTIAFGKPLHEFTVQEILDLGKNGHIFAAGRYQFIPTTLAEQVKKQGVPLNIKFSAAVQDFLAINMWRQVGNRWRQIWLGPAQKGTPEEQAFLDSMVGQLQAPKAPWRQPQFVRPELRGQ